ncbi:MAG: nucleotidyltransferase family protein [Chitinophagaceae bacterium]|jgi:predicted nucleotidyltransferase
MNELNQIIQELRLLKPELSDRFFVNEIGLYGSVTRDDFNVDSDVDIIVDFSKPIGIAFVDLADFLESKIHRKVDLVSKNAMRNYFYSSIEKEIQYV